MYPSRTSSMALCGLPIKRKRLDCLRGIIHSDRQTARKTVAAWLLTIDLRVLLTWHRRSSEVAPTACNDEFALHVVEVMTGILASGEQKHFVEMTTTCKRPEALGSEAAQTFWRSKRYSLKTTVKSNAKSVFSRSSMFVNRRPVLCRQTRTDYWFQAQHHPA